MDRCPRLAGEWCSWFISSGCKLACITRKRLAQRSGLFGNLAAHFSASSGLPPKLFRDSGRFRCRNSLGRHRRIAYPHLVDLGRNIFTAHCFIGEEHEQVEYDQSFAQLRAMLPEAEFNALWAEGKSMTMEQAIQLALESKPLMRG